MNRRMALGLGMSLAAAAPVVIFAAQARAAAVQIAAPLSGQGSAQRETALGNAVADAVRDASGADFALIPADEISETVLPSGALSSGQIAKALRYGGDPSDAVIVLHLTGAQIQKAAERALSRSPQAFDGFLQVSGLQIRYDASRPEGHRAVISSLEAGKTYRVAMPRSLAEGGLGYFKIWGAGVQKDDARVSVLDALTRYLSAHRTLSGKTEDRIVTE